MSSILRFKRSGHRVGGWNADEQRHLATILELINKKHGSAQCHSGRSDEGHPWFALCCPESDQVFVHIARIDDMYICAGNTPHESFVSSEMAGIVRTLMARHYKWVRLH